MSTHPLDSVLQSYGWRRVTPDDLGPERLETRVICRGVTLKPGSINMTAADVQMWRQVSAVRARSFSTAVFLRQVIAAGQGGISPSAIGLEPCRCSGKSGNQDRWNPSVVPLLFHEEMGRGRHFTKVVAQFLKLQRDRDWQCIDLARV